MATFWPQIYTKFDKVPVRISDDQKAIQAVLSGSTNLAGDVKNLKLYDPAGKIDPYSPLLDTTRIYMSTLQSAGKRVLGSQILEDFEAPPYGWDPNAVRVGVAALVRAGAVKVLINKKPYTNPSDRELIDALRVSRNFAKVELILEDTEIPPEILTETRSFLIQLAKKRAIDETPAALSEEAGKLAETILEKADSVTLSGGVAQDRGTYDPRTPRARGACEPECVTGRNCGHRGARGLSVKARITVHRTEELLGPAQCDRVPAGWYRCVPLFG
jgi:hypothetical protein